MKIKFFVLAAFCVVSFSLLSKETNVTPREVTSKESSSLNSVDSNSNSGIRGEDVIYEGGYWYSR